MSPQISKHNMKLIFNEDGAALVGPRERSALRASVNGTQCSQQEGSKSQWSSGLIDGGLGASREATERKKRERNTSRNTVLNMTHVILTCSLNKRSLILPSWIPNTRRSCRILSGVIGKFPESCAVLVIALSCLLAATVESVCKKRNVLLRLLVGFTWVLLSRMP